MDNQSPDYKKLFLEQEPRWRQLKAAEERANTLYEDARKTTLPEFLNACHTHLYAHLAVQHVSLSTQGNPANADNKLRPEKILEWKDFPERQAAIWSDLKKSDLVFERHFDSRIALKGSNDVIRGRKISSELDLYIFQRVAVEVRVSQIIERLFDNPTLREKINLRGSVQFENHANTLNSESPPIETRPSSRPRADQFCVYNTSTPNSGDKVAAFVIEHKAPYKLGLNYIDGGLEEMDLGEVVDVDVDELDKEKNGFRRLIAAVITLTFSYMVKMGSEYGCICTGEASIFLRVLEDDPTTVYYFLSVPKNDVGTTTGWTPDLDRENSLHLTAVGQMLAFTLQAVQSEPRSQQWRTDATRILKRWDIVYTDLFKIISPGNPPSSEYRPGRNNIHIRSSPFQLRPRKPQTDPSCEQPKNQRESSDEEPDPDTPSRPLLSQRRSRFQATANSTSSHSSGKGTRSGQYCTQDCLRGLVNDGPLDASCPNMECHGRSHHQINQRDFLSLVRQQLAEDMDTNCDPISRPGACGVLFRVRLRLYGYTVAAQATPIDFVQRLKWEATIYEHLRQIQGVHVPVHLGNIDLQAPYFYEGIAELVHMMFLSFGGKVIWQHITAENTLDLTHQVLRAAKAIHSLGVLHKDLMPRNILWSEETRQVMVVDFERAEVVKARPTQDILSGIWKRKGLSDSSAKRGSPSSVFDVESSLAVKELRGIANRT